MANRSGRKGSLFEAAQLPWWQRQWIDAHLLGKQGVQDKGDIWLPREVPFIVECKNEASYAGKLSTWCAEGAVEAEWAGKRAYVVNHKRHGKGDPQLQYITMEGWSFMEIIKFYESQARAYVALKG
jgi:hypothetical protein